MRYILLILTFAVFFTSFGQPTISFTFDDGVTSDLGGFKFEEWNEMILRSLDSTQILHHNLAAALFFDDLIDMFKSKGWKVISAHEAYEDPVYEQTPQHAGESLIWALAKDSGQFEAQLRYPAEDSRYEKARMDELGL